MKNSLKFWIDDDKVKIKSYQDILEFLTVNDKVIVNYHGNDYSLLYANFVKALFYDIDFTFLDKDFSESEIEKLTGSKYSQIEIAIKLPKYQITWDQLLGKIKNSNSKITLFTSGTTGLPKMVKHSIFSLTRMIRQGENYSKNVWAFCYNPTHIAGIQVFLQAFFNYNPIYYLFEKNSNYIIGKLKLNKITHISATPTFFRLMIDQSNRFDYIKRISIGGEKSNLELINKIEKIFPNAKLKNIYASTELGTIFSSRNDIFCINEQNKDYIKIKNLTLHVHKSIINTVQFDMEGDWYDTGDLIEWVSEDKSCFKFVSRKSEMINSGGYKIHPGEVEDCILSISGISSAVVYGKPNSVLGTVLIADVSLEDEIEITELQIKDILSTKLQSFKIPRKINFTKTIIQTRTGKINRNFNL